MVRKLVNNFIHTYAAPPSPFVRGGRLILEEKKFCQKLSEMAQKLVKLLFDTMTNDQDGGVSEWSQMARENWSNNFYDTIEGDQGSSFNLVDLSKTTCSCFSCYSI